MEFEVGSPFLGPCRHQLNTFAGALHQHLLERDHSGAAVIEVWNPIVAGPPEPDEPLAAVSSKLARDRFLRLRRQPQDRSVRSVLAQTGGLREEPGRIGPLG